MEPTVITRNSHLNLFRFFHESADEVFIENNLSRAFALCLENSSHFFNEYLRAVLSDDDYHYVFSASAHKAEYSVDLQINTNCVETEGAKKVYAVAMTANKNLDMSDCLEQKELTDKTNNITDVFISIKDIVIVIEVKRTWEDCKQQLYNQVLPFVKKENPPQIVPIKFSWPDVILLMERVVNVQTYLNEKSVFLENFLQLSAARYPDWFDPKPFAVLPFNIHWGSPGHSQLINRLRQALTALSPKYELLGYNDRLGLSVPFGWASELIPGFETHEARDYLVFYIWPGNTKGQGYGIYSSKSLDWVKQDSLLIDGKAYELDIAYNVKFSHFNRYISQLNFYPNNLLQELHTKDNFYHKSGKWDEEDWNEFETFLDAHFKKDYNWRKECGWEDNFRNTDRSYFTMSLGFEVAVYIPYEDFQAIDKRPEDISKVSAKIAAVADAFKKLI